MQRRRRRERPDKQTVDRYPGAPLAGAVAVVPLFEANSHGTCPPAPAPAPAPVGLIAVVESASHARRRAATLYAAVAGGALTSDAFHVRTPRPDGEGARAAISSAIHRAGVVPEEVDYVCALGTWTKANDSMETTAIQAALGRAAYDVPVSSPKSIVGRLIGAAGALGAIVCALAIRYGIVPPTINLDHPDPACDLDYVPHKARHVAVRTAIANAFGFGGQNGVVVFAAS